MRNISSAFGDAIDNQLGTEIFRALEIRFPAPVGTKWFASSDEAVPDAKGVVLDWGSLSLKPQFKTLGGHGQATLTLADPGLELQPYFSIKPGTLSVEAFVHLYVKHPDDADPSSIVEFAGTLAAQAKWSGATGAWTITIDGFEKRYNEDLGRKYWRSVFPESRCTECGENLVPIVIGQGVKRVECCAVDRPGSSYLIQTLGICDTQLLLTHSAEAGGFPAGVTIRLVVGNPPSFELVEGSFATSGTNVFDITWRSSIYFRGTVSDVTAISGIQYYVIPVPSSGANLRGYPIIFPDQGCSMEPIAYWIDAGSDKAVVAKGDRTFGIGEAFLVLRTVGYANRWAAGMPVVQQAPWVYAANYLPSSAVTAVEAITQQQSALGMGQAKDVWALYDPANYLVTLDNRDFNTGLGRESTDEGITTITLSQSPYALGISNPKLYVSHDGIKPEGGGAAITHPVRAIEKLAVNKWLGNVPTSKINATSLTNAETELGAVAVQIAITKPKKLWEAIAEIAFLSGGMLAFFDGGRLCLQYWPLGTPGSTDLDVDSFMIQPGSLELSEIDSRQLKNSIIAKWRETQGDAEGIILRQAPEAILAFGKQEDTVTVWTSQDPDEVARIAQYVLKRNLEQNRLITVRLFAQGARLQPGDALNMAFTAGGYAVIGKGRIRGISRQAMNIRAAQPEGYEVEVEVKLYSWEVDAAEQEACDKLPGVSVVIDDRGDLVPLTPVMPLPFSSSTSSSSTPPTTNTATATPGTTGPAPTTTPPGTETYVSPPDTLSCVPCIGGGTATWTWSTLGEGETLPMGICINSKLKEGPYSGPCMANEAATVGYGGPYDHEFNRQTDCGDTFITGVFAYQKGRINFSVVQISPTEWVGSVFWTIGSRYPWFTYTYSAVGQGSSAPVGSCNGPFPITVYDYSSPRHIIGTGVLSFS